MSILFEQLPQMKIDRNSLKDQALDRIKQLIVKGHIASGAKITERDIAELLGISRMPVRDALMDLERQGLIISRPGGRFVIQLTRDDVLNLYQVRQVLERLAVQLAAEKTNPENAALLWQKVQEIEMAVQMNDVVAYSESDLDLHRLVWQQANNPQLLHMLNSIIGPIFMFIANQTKLQENWLESLELHRALVDAICAGDVDRAIKSMDLHMQNSLDLSMQVF
jgi:DNA-binding GntR family transcriptional regulator